VLTGVLAFLLSLLALLAIPVSLTFHVSWQQDLQNDIRLKWAFGLVRMRIAPDRSGESSPEGEKVQQKIARSGRAPGKERNVFAVIRQKRFRQRIIRFVSDLWHAIHKKNVNLRARIGLGDPADTGQLWAMLGPMAGMLASIQEVSITIEPEFLDTTIELDGSGSIRIIPLQIIYLTTAMLLSPPVWRGIRQIRTVEQ